MARVTDRNDWFDLWFEDKKSIVSTMVRNMAADLAAGYDYFGANIAKQRDEINRYKAEFDAEIDAFKSMEETAVNRWCFYDLKKRGAIE